MPTVTRQIHTIKHTVKIVNCIQIKVVFDEVIYLFKPV